MKTSLQVEEGPKKYGTLDHFKGSWVFKVEPYVAIRLKRLFPRMANKQDFLGIADTLETAREIEWFTARYPLDFASAEVEHRLSKRASEHREGQHLIDLLISGKQKATEFRLAVPAREYQKAAAQMAIVTRGLLVAYPMGLGKTAIAICAMTDPRTRPALVVTLTHLPKQWQAELRKFAPQLTSHVLQGTRPYDLRKQCNGVIPDVILTSYSKLAGWGDYLQHLCSLVCYDEVQELRRGAESKKGEAALAISRKANFRIGLSGTPFLNLGGEMWNVCEALRPGTLGTKSEFGREWCTGDAEQPGKLKIKNPTAFGAYLRDSGLMIRKTKEEVGRELPSLSRVPHYIDFDEHHLRSVESKATKLAEIILAKQESARGAKMQAAEELSSLVRQATGVAKGPFVAEFLRMIVDSGESVLCYGWHRSFYAIVMESLKDLSPAMYTGSESDKQKEEAKRRFCEGETKVLLMSLRSGAGLDGLQHHCQTVVFGELDYSPGIHEQAIARVHRDGQLQPVIAYFLLADSGSDPILSDILGIKRAQIEGVRDLQGESVELLDASTDHVKRLALKYLEKKVGRSA